MHTQGKCCTFLFVCFWYRAVNTRQQDTTMCGKFRRFLMFVADGCFVIVMQANPLMHSSRSHGIFYSRESLASVHINERNSFSFKCVFLHIKMLWIARIFMNSLLIKSKSPFFPSFICIHTNNHRCKMFYMHCAYRFAIKIFQILFKIQCPQVQCGNSAGLFTDHLKNQDDFAWKIDSDLMVIDDATTHLFTKP